WIASRVEVIKQIGRKAHIRCRKGQLIEVRADAEAIRNSPGGGDGPEGGPAGTVMAEVIEQIGAIAHVRGREDQGVEVGADAEAIRDGAREGGVDGPEGGPAGTVMAEVIEQIGAIAHVCGRKG